MSNKIIDRIRKLLELSRSNNSPEEAARAAALAQDMMFKYQIGEGDIDTTDTKRAPEEIITDGIRPGDRQRVIWKSSLAHAVALGCGCEMYSSREWVGDGQRYETTFKIFGTKTAVQTVQYLYGYLVLEITRLAEEGYRAHGQGHGRTWKNSFKLGAVNEIRRRLSEQRRAQQAHVAEAVKAAQSTETAKATETAQSTALALYQTDEQRVSDSWKVESKRLRLRTVSSGRRNHNPTAYDRGKSAGRGIGLGGGKAGLPASKGRIE